jgi:LacI family transcriptional regulator
MNAKHPTMRDIAERAGVSKATVSHVVNGTRFVGGETRDSVLRAIAELDYRPSVIARSLATRRTETIGVITSEVSYQFLGETLQGIGEVLYAKGYAIFLYHTPGLAEREMINLDLALRDRVDGIIAAATSERWHAATYADLKSIPAVFMDRPFDGLKGPYVGADNARGAALAVEHFLACGFREIGILTGPPALLNMGERLAGFRAAMARAGLPVRDDWVIPGPLDAEGGYRAMQQLLALRPRPGAVLINSEQLTLGALRTLQEAGVGCPEDLALISFDEYPWAAVACPPLTTVRIPNRELGRLAAETLLAMLSGHAVPEQPAPPPCELVLRQSCCTVHA